MNAFVPGFTPPASRCEPALWFAFHAEELLIDERAELPRVPCVTHLGELHLRAEAEHYLGHLDGRHCYAAELADPAAPPPGMAFRGLRPMLVRLEEDLYWVAARAIQILEWDRTHRFCGRCGVPLVPKHDERARQCAACGLLQFPRISPAILALVHREDRLILARQPHFAPGYYSIVAGFVEPGETLEEAVAREVREEVGVEIRDIRYFGSQPWPFPHNLMVGFTAQHAGGEIKIDAREIEDAHWFGMDGLPELPRRPTLSRKMIDWFLANASRPGETCPLHRDPHASDQQTGSRFRLSTGGLTESEAHSRRHT
jgi:NAD+ diphosphatase